MMNKKILFSLLAFTGVSLFLHFFMWDKSPPCFSVDEAAYGYNAYSILKTGMDEFGRFFPLRLQSFGDFKLPMYSYLTIPFVLLFGLTEFSTRLPTYLAAAGLIWIMYFLIKELSENKRQALIGASLVSLSPWINTISRHAHEVIVATFFIMLGLLFLIKYVKKQTLFNAIVVLIALAVALYTYHIARLFVGLFSAALLYLFFFKHNQNPFKKTVFIIVALIIFLPFVVAEIKQPPSRLGSLLLTNNEGIDLKTNELKTEFRFSPFSTKPFVVFDEFLKRYFSYFSSDFLVQKGDAIARFGYSGEIHPITHVEFVLAIIGLFILFKKNKKVGIFILLLLLISPLPAALTWQEYALTRSFFLIVPLLIFVSYGVEFLLVSKYKSRILFVSFAIFFYLLYVAKSWDFFYFHYPKRAQVVRSWFCGYKELASFIKENYSSYNRFYITQEVGQPYIALLFYTQYSPSLYQKQISLSPKDEYGYTKINGFDKYVFDISSFDKQVEKNSVYVFSESEAKNRNIKYEDALHIKIRTEEMFWIYIPKKISNHNKTPT